MRRAEGEGYIKLIRDVKHEGKGYTLVVNIIAPKGKLLSLESQLAIRHCHYIINNKRPSHWFILLFPQSHIPLLSINDSRYAQYVSLITFKLSFRNNISLYAAYTYTLDFTDTLFKIVNSFQRFTWSNIILIFIINCLQTL